MNPPGAFVTGGTGYIGRSLIEALLGRGYAVRAVAGPPAEGVRIVQVPQIRRAG